MSTISLTQPEHILLLGGTFDPIHLGHILPAKETATWLSAKQVSLIPAHIPPHKQHTHANAEQRAAMANLVCLSDNLFKLDKRELQRSKHSFTVDTLIELKAERPNAHLYFIMGMDSLLSFTKWQDWQKILTLCHLVVNIRPGYCHLQLETKINPALKPHLIENILQLRSQAAGKIILHECNAFDISSTQIRNDIHAGKSYAQFVTKQVHHYIEQQQLYR